MDNFVLLRQVLKFEHPEDFYYMTILQRRKDVPELDQPIKKLRSYYIRSLDDFDRYMPDIIQECKLRSARAYIDLNVKDAKKVALLTLKKVADYVYQGEYLAMRKVYESACGEVGTRGEKLWLIDIDSMDQSVLEHVECALQKLNIEPKIKIPSKSGMHWMTPPFPLHKFEKIENVDVLKHGFTLLYV